MADHRITDFVDQQAIDSLKKLREEIDSVKASYIEAAKEIIKGLNMKVDGLDDLEKLTKLMQESQRKAGESTEKLSKAFEGELEVIGKTTAAISRQLDAVDKEYQQQRQAYTEREKNRLQLESTTSTYDKQIARLNALNEAIKENKEQQKRNKEEWEKGTRTAEEFLRIEVELVKAERQLKQEKANVTTMLKNEERLMATTAGSYAEMSQQLELMKKQYKQLSQEEREGDVGKQLQESIKSLSAELKDIDQSMGDFHRNVGNYAVACNDGVVVTEDLNRVLGIEASTIEGCIEQNKELEKAKNKLNTSDADYAANIDRINAKMEENRRRIVDVDEVMRKQATSVGEAESQNKQLAEALKLIDLNSSGARERIQQINAKIEENKKLIAEATPALQDYSKASEGLVDSMLKHIGISDKFGGSFKNMGAMAQSGGSMIDGLTIKLKAFSKTLIGIISNPWVLALLGIGGTLAAAKWWYDYNKGLIEASRLTENFTGKTGAAADKVTADMQTLADRMGKGYNETIGAANTLVQQFGISWDEAYEKMKDGIAAGADMSGNMLSNIDRFGPALRDAGVSADEFMAILSETRNGIFNEDGIQSIVKAGTKLRAMTKQTEESLEAVGISAKKMQADLESGNISMLDAVQQVATKLKELPENSQESGQVMKNVFGRAAAEGGTLLIQSIADVNTNLEKAKENMGELGKVNEEQMNAQRRLNEILMSVFKMSGTSFEQMITQAKTFVTKGIIKIIEGCVGIVNWFIKLYNQSLVVRGAFNSIVLSFKNIWEVAKFVVNQLIDSFKALGTVIEGVLTLDIDKIVSGYKQSLGSLKANVSDLVSNILSNTNDAIKSTLNSELKEISIDIKAEYGDDEGTGRKAGGKSPGKKRMSDAERKAAEKAAKEEIKRINDLEEAKIKAMEDGHEKEMATIKHNYMKKIREIRGESENEKEARIALMEAMHADLMKCEEKYQRNLETINLANRLAMAKKGSKAEFDIKVQQLDMQRQAEIEEAQKTGADVFTIREKYEKMKRDLAEEYAGYRIKEIQDDAAVEGVIADNAFSRQLTKLKEKYAESIKAAGNNEEKRAKITKDYENQVADLTEKYAIQTASTKVSMIEEMLEVEDLSAKERASLEAELAKANIDLEDAIADAAIAANQRKLDSDNETTQKRIANAQKWLQIASQGLNAINDLSSAIFDAKIQRIEEELEANTEAGEKETEMITGLVEKKVITEEEGEARKRAAEAKTAQKEQELERKKQEMQHKQAIWNKANSLAQAGIATALAITQALPNIVLAAIAGAMGAVQIATILATPIPKYAKGTDYHPGGIAVVGDAGKQEIVSFGGNMYLTPDSPTLVDIPRGAVVYPDVESLLSQPLVEMPSMASIADAPNVVVNNDYARLERQMSDTNALIRQLMKQQHADAYYSDYQAYKRSRL